MPRAEEVASSFMAGGRGDALPAQMEHPIDVCFPQNNKVPGFDLSGGTKTQGVGADYDPIPEVKNPRSVSDQSPKLDAQGK